MGNSESVQAGLARAAVRFPEAASSLRSLARTDPEFCELCVDYALAQDSLAWFVARPDAAERFEIGEFKTVIAELECEIDRYLKEAMPKN